MGSEKKNKVANKNSFGKKKKSRVPFWQKKSQPLKSANSLSMSSIETLDRESTSHKCQECQKDILLDTLHHYKSLLRVQNVSPVYKE